MGRGIHDVGPSTASTDTHAVTSQAHHAASTLITSLRIMALKPRDVAIVAFVGFVAWGFVTSWAPILRYIGYAFVAGLSIALLAIGIVVLFSLRQKQDGVQASSRSSRTLAFVAPQTWEGEIKWLSSRALYKRTPLYPPSFVLSDSLDGLLDWVLRDFVTTWYSNIAASPNFVNEVDCAIRTALINIRDRIFGVDTVEIAVSRIVPIISRHLKEFHDAERAIRGKHLNRDVTESEDLDLAIAGKYRDGKLHPAASLAYSDTKLVQQEYLRRIVVRLLPEVLPERMIRSRAVSVLIKEIMSCAVLAPLMQILSDPDTWNQLMEAYVFVTVVSSDTVTDRL